MRLLRFAFYVETITLATNEEVRDHVRLLKKIDLFIILESKSKLQRKV